MSSRTGVVRDFVGLANFANAFSDPIFLQAARQTVDLDRRVVGGTLLVSVPVAIDPQRGFLRPDDRPHVMLLPWAISLAMTAVVWRYVVNGDFGTLNMTLVGAWPAIRQLSVASRRPPPFRYRNTVGILVSVPFTVTILHGGLTSIPGPLYEASALDGASAVRSFTSITLPLLRPFMQIAVVLNVIYVFNSFPIIWIMTNGGPSNRTDILITYVYKQAFVFGNLGNAAAGSVAMFAMLLVFAGLYLSLTRSTETADND
jgi:multiple sugar transport system permease protein